MTVNQAVTTSLSAACLVLASGLAYGTSQYGPGVTEPKIEIGNTMPYSGPASAYGAIGKSSAAYFAMINDQGGKNGRKVEFISRDDGYSPPKTVELVRKWSNKIRFCCCLNRWGQRPIPQSKPT
jgi:ABC-type branched-subunit amino acid transport system substrate-binding protein